MCTHMWCVHAYRPHHNASPSPAAAASSNAAFENVVPSNVAFANGGPGVLSLTSRRVRLSKEWREVENKAGCSEFVCMHVCIHAYTHENE